MAGSWATNCRTGSAPWSGWTGGSSRRPPSAAHERRSRLRDAAALLSSAGLAVRSARHGSMIPKNLDRLPFLRHLFDEHHQLVVALDAFLLRIPLLNLLSRTWGVVGQGTG